MKIVAHEDDTGCAPRSCRFYAIDADTYDGAPDSRTRSTIGYGATPDAAIADLLALLADDLSIDTDWLREERCVSLTLSPQIIAIPQPDADGYWHYTYITHHPDTGEWYAGKHSTADLDDGYLGSGEWIRNHPARNELVTEVVEFFYSEDHAYAAEAALVDFRIIDADPLCRNRSEGGFGQSRETCVRLAANPEWIQKHRASIVQMIADPEWRRKNRAWAARRGAIPELQKKMKEVGARNAANPEWQRKLREGLARRNAKPECWLMARENGTRLAADPEWRRKNREAVARNVANPEWHRKVHEGLSRRNADPEWHRKNREGLAKRDANRQARNDLDIVEFFYKVAVAGEITA